MKESLIAMNMKVIYAILLYATMVVSGYAQPISVSSPNQKLTLEVNVGDDIAWTVKLANQVIVKKVVVSMDMGNERVLGEKSRLKKQKVNLLEESMQLQIPNKNAEINTRCNQLLLTFKEKFQLEMRVYNDGVAYRFIDQLDESQDVYGERMNIQLPLESRSRFPEEESLYSHNEREYKELDIKNIEKGRFCSLPVMFETGETKVLFTEASLHNYPGMFLEKSKGENSFETKFTNYVLEAIPDESTTPDRSQILKRQAEYIAKTEGARSFPWRVFMISDDDRTFVSSDLVTALSQPSKMEDVSWIKPGKVAWDWYNANNIYGVDFEAGLNQETYKYYIDFASQNNIEYVILDEGWTKSTTEIMEDNTEMDVPALIQYAKSKNVGIILWVLWKPLDENTEEILKLYSDWGAAGVKVDFMQRNDQYMVKSYEVIAEVAAKYKLMVDYHGAFKPSGIERVWPNVVNYEGVLGNEQNKWTDIVDPEHNTTLPFIRMAAGPMDFTPGAMINMNKKDYETGKANYAALFTRPMAYGTRAHQVAMYVVYEAPLQMMCESPTIYMKEQETVDFMTQIPTTWDETVVLEGKVADYIVVARRHGDDWYIGAMTDWTAREFEIDLSFLGEGNYQMFSMKDGVNAHRNAQDYKLSVDGVSKSSSLKMDLSSGGGYVAILKKK
ncbi:MAG: glycoside hydrolase family 97 protein [Bacteroidota bacterium]